MRTPKKLKQFMHQRTDNGKISPLISSLLYILGGSLSAMLHYSTAYVLYYLYALPPLFANALGFLLASLLSYSWHNYLTFAARIKLHTGYVRFLQVAGLGLLLSQLLLWLCYYRLHVGFMLAQILALISVPPLTFCCHKYWTYRICYLEKKSTVSKA